MKQKKISETNVGTAVLQPHKLLQAGVLHRPCLFSTDVHGLHLSYKTDDHTHEGDYTVVLSSKGQYNRIDRHHCRYHCR